MEISGKYKEDQNFITIFSDNTIYTIARNTGNWGCRSVGENMYIGGTITQEVYDTWESECEYEGTFTLKEYGNEYDEYEDEEYDEDEEDLEW